MDTPNNDDAADLSFDGESTPLAALLRDRIAALRHAAQPRARREALAAIASHLDLTRKLATREALLAVLKAQLWREDDPDLARSLAKVIVDVAAVPVCASPGQDANGAVAGAAVGVLQEFLTEKELGLGLQLQVLHSLLKLAERGAGAVAPGFSVRRQLRNGDPRVRAVALRLLVESVRERGLGVAEWGESKRRRVENDEHDGSKVSEALLSYMKDPYPAVRETALRALVKMHGKGFELTSECCKNAASLFRDSFDYVRVAAIELVGLWMRIHLDLIDQSSLRQHSEAFLQVCTTVTDMNVRVREAAFRVLGEATRIPDYVLLQTLTKKMAKAPKEADVSSSAPTAAKDGNAGSPKFEEGSNLLDASAAGAFVHGLEDEYLEVRCAAIEALAKLACKCEKMVFGAANLLLDMLNEEVDVVRMQAMQALLQLATAGRLSVHDQHRNLFLSVVEDVSPEMRTGGRNLLASSLLPSFSTFHSIIRALLTSLEHHPEDEVGAISTFSVLGQIHPTYTECISQELLQEMQGYLNEEVGLDEPRFAAILSLFLGAGLSNSNSISLVPARFLSYASFISHKLPESLPLLKLRPVGFKSLRFSWSNREKRKMSGHVGALHVSTPVARSS